MTERIVTLTLNPAIDIATMTQKLSPFDKLRCDPERRDPGGGGINVARVILRLGGNALAVFPAGGGTGAMLEHMLRKEGLAVRSAQIDGTTREDFSVIERASGNEYRFVMPGPVLSDGELSALLDTVLAEAEGGAVVVASGSLPPHTRASFYAELSAALKAKGAKLVLDTSGTPLKLALEEGVWLVKPNRTEISELVGTRLRGVNSWCKAARDIVTSGKAQIVALSIAAEGALLVTRTGCWHAHAPAIKPVSTVGAGDSFLGALICSLASEREPADALRHAVAAGSAALLAPGTELAHTEGIAQMLEQTSVEPL
ncbi:MAG: hexose kinase [Alphaproteobacteria bacterium]|nr:hexose kinase [Alphaproteobacteria bacterium]